MNARPARASDLEAVFNNLSPRMEREYARANLSVDDFKTLLRSLMNRRQANVLLRGDRPQAIIAWKKSGDGYATAFAAEEPFFRKSTVRFCRKHLMVIHARLDHATMRAYSYSDMADDELTQWFNLVGFREIGVEKGARVFELGHPQQTM